MSPSAEDVALKTQVKILQEQMTLRFPMQLMLSLQQTVGQRLLVQAGAKTTSAGARAIPLLGGVVGGSVDAVSMAYSSATAKRIFSGRLDTESQLKDLTEEQLRAEVEELATTSKAKQARK